MTLQISQIIFMYIQTIRKLQASLGQSQSGPAKRSSKPSVGLPRHEQTVNGDSLSYLGRQRSNGARGTSEFLGTKRQSAQPSRVLLQYCKANNNPLWICCPQYPQLEASVGTKTSSSSTSRTTGRRMHQNITGSWVYNGHASQQNRTCPSLLLGSCTQRTVTLPAITNENAEPDYICGREKTSEHDIASSKEPKGYHCLYQQLAAPRWWALSNWCWLGNFPGRQDASGS